MSHPKLTDAEIRKQLQQGRNYRRLYEGLKVRFDTVVAENKQLRAENDALKQTVATLQIQIAELQTMVFGKKKRPPAGTAVPALPFATPTPRNKASFRRPTPPAEAVTATETVPLPPACVHCGSKVGFTQATTKIRYEEDIPLPELTPGYIAHLVTKYDVVCGRCIACGKTASGRDLGGAEVGLGPNVRLLVCDLVGRLGLSYAQVASLLLGLYGFTVSDGELATILERQHQAWLPASERLKADIRAAPAVHADETSWPLQDHDGLGQAWVLADAASPNVCYSLADSRGSRHARQLFGSEFEGVRISDDYGAYRALPGQQQLCWAHLYRVIRDLRYNDNLPDGQLRYVDWWYGQFAAVYQDLRQYLAEPYGRTVRQTQAGGLWVRLQPLLLAADGEPAKLAKLKAQLMRAGKDRLFTCLTANTPCDNNRAERDLRQLVLKRKRSFGSKTQKGANALATILSICTTTWRRWGSSPAGYYRVLSGV